jgi:hypothetical protein
MIYLLIITIYKTHPPLKNSNMKNFGVRVSLFAQNGLDSDPFIISFLPNRIPAAEQLRERVTKWDFVKLKSFCTTKEIGL